MGDVVQQHAHAFSRAPRPATRSVHASGTRWRKPSRAGRGSQVLDAATCRRTDATGIGWCRRAAGRQPHSRARIDGSQGVPARRFTVAEVGERHRDPQEARPAGNGRVNGGRVRTDPKGHRRAKGRRRPASRWPHRGVGQGRSRALERASRGEGSRSMEGTSGRSPARHRSRERDGGDLGGPHDGTFARERGVRREGGDRGARGTARTHRHGKTTPAAMAPLEERAARRSESHWREAGDLPSVRRRLPRSTHREPTRRGCSYEYVRRQKSVRRTPVPWRSAIRKENGARGTGRGGFRTTC